MAAPTSSPASSPAAGTAPVPLPVRGSSRRGPPALPPGDAPAPADPPDSARPARRPPSCQQINRIPSYATTRRPTSPYVCSYANTIINGARRKTPETLLAALRLRLQIPNVRFSFKVAKRCCDCNDEALSFRDQQELPMPHLSLAAAHSVRQGEMRLRPRERFRLF